MKKFAIIIGIILLVKYSECCDCKENSREAKAKGKPKGHVKKHNSKMSMDKRQLDSEYDGSEAFEYSESSDVALGSSKRTVLNETHFELNETEFSTAIVESNRCPFYKPSQNLDMEKMVDIWKLVFYRSAVDLGCLKILIKGLSNEARQFYQEKYGNFNETIRWDDSMLQLSSNGNGAGAYETHFLQAVVNYTGLLDNIILSEENSGNLSILSLQDHSPDQWLALDKLLLMRDCDNGDVIIFTKIPNNPTQPEIDEALTQFGEENKHGIWACTNKKEEHMKNPKYQILS